MERRITIFLLFVSVFSYSQNEDYRTIPSVSEWLEEINNWPDTIYRQDRLIISIDPKLDSTHVFFPKTLNLPQNHIPLVDSKYIVDKEVWVTDIIFDISFIDGVTNNFSLAFRNLQFLRPLNLVGIKNGRVFFSHCQFDELWIARPEIKYNLEFHDCDFNQRMGISNPSHPTRVRFYSCNGKEVSVGGRIVNPSLRIYNSNIELLSIPSETTFGEVIISDSHFSHGLDFQRSTISNFFNLSRSGVGGIDIGGTDLPMFNSYIPFDSLRNKLTEDLWYGYNNTSSGNFKMYQGRTEEELQDKPYYDRIIASYSKIISIYKTRNQMEDYNTAYIEMRDKMTARSKLLYQQNPSFNCYFDYQINRFTKMFSDYGTRPAKAIVIFFQVVLAFSIFYFFFPSSWNSTNSRKMMKHLSYLGGYFKSDQGLSDLFEKESKAQYQDYNEFKAFMDSSEKELPIYFQWLSKPLYHISISKFNFSRSVLQKSDILNGKWVQLPKRRKMITSLIIAIYLIIYLLYILIIRCLNAITLSLNAFSTLGFGEIPTRGLARYVTIIQGFIGWFLLSIFLVSLIGQILN